MTRFGAAITLTPGSPEFYFWKEILKTYRSPRELLAEIESQLADNRASLACSPLEEVSATLSKGRHYSWVGIYLTVAGPGGKDGHGPHPAQKAHAGSRSKILVSMKLAGHEFGVLDVESDRENAFGVEDRVLLENAAFLLARFLAGRGRYLVRKARNRANAS